MLSQARNCLWINSTINWQTKPTPPSRKGWNARIFGCTESTKQAVQVAETFMLSKPLFNQCTCTIHTSNIQHTINLNMRYQPGLASCAHVVSTTLNDPSTSTRICCTAAANRHITNTNPCANIRSCGILKPS